MKNISVSNFNANIVDQRVEGIVEQYPELFPYADADKKKSVAFVLLCMSTALELSIEEASELLTDGGNDAGIDGLHIGEVDDGEFTVVIFQAKYKRNLNAEANFPERDVQHVINTVASLFDPDKKLSLNEKIVPKVEEIRSFVRDGYIPTVKVMLCNNGAKWTQIAQDHIESAKFGGQVTWAHFNHDNIVAVLQRKKAVDDDIQSVGKAIVEDFNFRRVMIGKVAVREIAELFDRHGDLLLEGNIRRYLGLHENRVNDAIFKTLHDKNKRENFYFFNNGITMICRKFDYNALQSENYLFKVKGMQIINGGQTCKTIQQTLKKMGYDNGPDNAYVLVRLYQLSDNDQDFIPDITYATNSQNPVDLRDLHSNDKIQQRLKMGIESLGYHYKPQRGGEAPGGGSLTISSTIVAEAVLAIWRARPVQAKVLKREHFGKLYETIFENLNAAEAILAVLIFRFVENERKDRTWQKLGDNYKCGEVCKYSKFQTEFLPYASHYLAMLIGRRFLTQEDISVSISHKNFRQLLEDFENRKEEYYQTAISQIQQALITCYGNRKISLQQLSATFRRGDLLEILTVNLRISSDS